MLIHGGTSAMAHSVVQAAVCSTVSPRPPCSTGQWSPAQPGLEQRPLPGPALLGQVRGQDRAVVAGRLGLVGGQPAAGPRHGASSTSMAADGMRPADQWNDVARPRAADEEC